MSEVGNPTTFYTKSGLERYEVRVRHTGLNQYQVVRGDDVDVVWQKAHAKVAQWDQRWERQQQAEDKRKQREAKALKAEQKTALAAERTAEVERTQQGLQEILLHTLSIDDAINWELLKDRSAFPDRTPQPPAPPKRPDSPSIPPEPQRTAEAFTPALSIIDKLITSRRLRKEMEAQQAFEDAHSRWESGKRRRLSEHTTKLEAWKAA